MKLQVRVVAKYITVVPVALPPLDSPSQHWSTNQSKTKHQNEQYLSPHPLVQKEGENHHVLGSKSTTPHPNIKPAKPTTKKSAKDAK